MYAGGDGGNIVFVYTALASNILPLGKCIQLESNPFYECIHPQATKY